MSAKAHGLEKIYTKRPYIDNGRLKMNIFMISECNFRMSPRQNMIVGKS